ncbi:hypothetical protein B0H11DRAFT_1926746 [Mycena galericulata]|nr:hypothetical protein B0H11DRAFT_1926746 [Mycena galericulata]
MSNQANNGWYFIEPNVFTEDRHSAFDLSEASLTRTPAHPCYVARTLAICTKYLAALPEFRTFFMPGPGATGELRQIRPIFFLVDDQETTDLTEAEKMYHARPHSEEAPTILAFPTKVAADSRHQKIRRERDELGSMRG